MVIHDLSEMFYYETTPDITCDVIQIVVPVNITRCLHFIVALSFYVAIKHQNPMHRRYLGSMMGCLDGFVRCGVVVNIYIRSRALGTGWIMNTHNVHDLVLPN